MNAGHDAEHTADAAHGQALPGREEVADLADWVGIASVSSDPDRADDVRESARWLVGTLRRAAFLRAEVWETDGLPAVYGCRPAADSDAPVLLVYSHHDVHAVDPSEWRITPPFSPLRDGDRLYGRGASDAKGQVMCHLWALGAHTAERDAPAPAVTVKYLVEGEEEVGSVHLADLLSQHADDLGADVVMVSDSMLWSLDEPAVCGVVRGSVTATLTVRGARRDIHSGAVSGAASNAAFELCRVLDLLTDESQRITLPGFYDAVTEPAPAHRQRRGDPCRAARQGLRRARALLRNGPAGGPLARPRRARGDARAQPRNTCADPVPRRTGRRARQGRAAPHPPAVSETSA
ncbi:M20/M25/M40 family metallo-hydrolase [Streptomyces virginiae]|uniref:M20/M25/M40 family metallo-hydrolase n=1 Tax=Streptomyces virginiae TaxID=1961 RepID=UPI00342B43B9